MTMTFLRACAVSALLLGVLTPVSAQQAPIEYRLSFTDVAHRVMQVDVTFSSVPAGPLHVRMSRSSPGRYAAHEFAKNVFKLTIADGKGRALTAARPNPHEWAIAGHDGTVRITYQLFGDRVDGTYLAVDSSHAHMNAPATLMWAKGLETRPARVTLTQPAGKTWKVATQLYPTNDPLTFTAPNMQYLLDSPIEFSDHALRTFTVPSLDGGRASTIRVAMHHLGTDAELDAYVADVEKVVREQQAIFGELPPFEPGHYTFLADYLPWSGGDGMEHRNSTVVCSSASLGAAGRRLVSTASHEFFHAWNVERIRPATLEPFNFEDANISGELWLAEGFTNYYGRLAMIRAGVTEATDGVAGWGSVMNGFIRNPGVKFRSAVEMSRLAPFLDGATAIDPTYLSNTSYSYYPFGDMIALALDLSLRGRSNGKVTLDDFMRAMWKTHGKPGGPAPGLVAKPYTLADVRARLAEVSGDKAFADDFMNRYIEGTEQADYAPLLARAGFLLRKTAPNRPTLGALRLQADGGQIRVAGRTLIGSPAYLAGLDEGDQILTVAGTTIASAEGVEEIIASRKPGDEVTITFLRRGAEIEAKATLAEDPTVEIVPVERDGATLSAAQQQFRKDWLGSKVKK